MEPLIDTYVRERFINSHMGQFSPSLLSCKGSLALWERVIELLTNKANLFLDLTPDKFIELESTSTIFKNLRKASQSAIIKLNFEPNKFNEAEVRRICSKKGHSVFLLDENDNTDLIFNDFGQYALKQKSLMYDKFFFRPDWTLMVSTEINKNQFKGWSFLREIQAPSNFMIIADQHIFDNNDKLPLEYNIFQIIKNAIPANLSSGCFNLIIITKAIDKVMANKKIKSINEFIQTLPITYKINVAIFCSPKEKTHDRDLLTNYYWLHSGHCFNFIGSNKAVRENTSLHFHTLVSETKNYKLVLSKFMQLIRNSKDDLDKFGETDLSFDI